MMRRFIILWTTLGLVNFGHGCYPTIPSKSCQDQMSACLAKCEPEQQQRSGAEIGRGPNDRRSTCEDICDSVCKESAATPQPDQSLPVIQQPGAQPKFTPPPLNPPAVDGGAAAAQE